ncbi:MAG: hypothetical protein MZV70_30115 [Desulfobacterales bacterium]|nr:hypothetical protein [Desulfobacterales bacterium]
MATVDGLDYLESSSIEGMYTLQANFKLRRERGRRPTRTPWRRWRAWRGSCPRTSTRRSSSRPTRPSFPVVQLTISSDQWDLVKLRDLDGQLAPGPAARRAGRGRHRDRRRAQAGDPGPPRPERAGEVRPRPCRR